MMAMPVTSSGMAISQLLHGFVADDLLPELRVTGLSADSRAIKPGDLFIAQAGLTRNAIDYASDAIQAGAIAVLYDAADDYAASRVALLSKQFDSCWIALPGLQQRTGIIASRFYANPSQSMRVIGVTGTDGKTSVTHLLVQALMKLQVPVASIGTLGYGMANNLQMTGYTTPDAIAVQSMLAEFRRSQCRYVVMEVSSHALHQQRVSGCEFDVAVLTNLGSDHLDFHGSVEAYAEAKSLLFDVDTLRARVVNLDDALGRTLAAVHREKSVCGYSSRQPVHEDAVVRLLDQRMSDSGLQIRVATQQGELEIQTDLIGRFNVDNCLAVVSVLSELGFTLSDIERVMQHLRPIPGRMDYFAGTNTLPSVVIDFAHTEQALRACLEALSSHTQGELYCVFGCGGDRDQSKRPRMAAVAEMLADHVFVTDDNPRTESPQQIMRDILAGFKTPEAVRVIHDRETAIRAALSQAGANDLVVIAGKGHEPYQIVGDRHLVFSDHQVVRDIRAEAKA